MLIKLLISLRNSNSLVTINERVLEETSGLKKRLLELVALKLSTEGVWIISVEELQCLCANNWSIAKFKNEVNVAVTGAKSSVYNDKDLAKALSKNFTPSSIDNIKISPIGMNSDIHASAEYRANMIKVFAKKAVEAC